MSASASQLVAVVRAGPFRLAVPAGEVREVARLAAGQTSLAGEPVLKVGEALGAAAAPLSWALRLASPERPALGVELMEGVLDLAGTTRFHLPAVLGPRPMAILSGAVLIGGALALELQVEALLATAAEPEPVREPWSVRYVSEPAERALIVVVAGHSMGFALPCVLAVMAVPPVAPVPRVPSGQRGVVMHAQTLCPVLDVGDLLFGRPTAGAFGVVVDMEGTTWVVLADAVLGVRSNFRPTAGDQPGWMESNRGERALFPLFPSDAGGLKQANPR